MLVVSDMLTRFRVKACHPTFSQQPNVSEQSPNWALGSVPLY
jgi:hypothetical protein